MNTYFIEVLALHDRFLINNIEQQIGVLFKSDRLVLFIVSTEPLDFVFKVNQLLQKAGVDVNISSSLDMFQCVLGSPVLTQHQESHDASGGSRFAEHAVHVDLVGRARRQCLLNVRRDIFKVSEIERPKYAL